MRRRRSLAELEIRSPADYPVLTPLAVGPGQPFPISRGSSLSLGVHRSADPDPARSGFRAGQGPETLSRFVAHGRRGLMTPLERVISH
jgi:polyphosphate kinase